MESEPVRRLKFEWDEAKNRANIRKHGFDFADAEQMFGGVLIVQPDTREDYGEDRWMGLGLLDGRVVAIIFARPGSETVRIIVIEKG